MSQTSRLRVVEEPWVRRRQIVARYKLWLRTGSDASRFKKYRVASRLAKLEQSFRRSGYDFVKRYAGNLRIEIVAFKD